MREWRISRREVFLPLLHPPGEAQVDFGEATVRMAGGETKVAIFVMTLPYLRRDLCAGLSEGVHGDVHGGAPGGL